MGVAALDIIALVPAIPGSDGRVVAREWVVAGGGPAATAAVTVARLGVPVAFVGAVGDDDEGDRILADLVVQGVDISGVARVAGSRSGVCMVVVDQSSGDRMIVSRPGPEVRVRPGERASELLATAEWVHVDHMGWAAVRSREEQMRARLSVDGGNPILQFSPAEVDLYVPTVAALRARYGDRPTPELLAAALADGASCVVATQGGEGAVAAERDGDRSEVGALEVDVVSTLGAGDVFHGALLATTVLGLPLAERLGFANTVAALSCRSLDGRSAIPTYEEAVAALQSTGRRTPGLVSGSRPKTR